MIISRNTSWSQFIEESKHVKSSVVAKITNDVVVMFVNDDYYEVDLSKQTFGRLALVGMMSYQRGTLVSKDRIDVINKMTADIKVTSVTANKCKLFCFRRVGMVYAS